MTLFFIEMGQGIVVDGDVSVCTSTLFSCSLIAGWNQHTGAAGAFHYPAASLDVKGVRQDMDSWAARLQPTQVILIVAKAANSMEVDLFGQDERDLINWIKQECGVTPTVDHQTVGAMSLDTGQFNAGLPSALPGGIAAFSRNKAVAVNGRQAGVYTDHGGFTLVGLDRENNPTVVGQGAGQNGHRPACCILL